MTSATEDRSRGAVSQPELRTMLAEWSYEAAARHADATLADFYKMRDQLARLERRVAELAASIKAGEM